MAGMVTGGTTGDTYTQRPFNISTGSSVTAATTCWNNWNTQFINTATVSSYTGTSNIIIWNAWAVQSVQSRKQTKAEIARLAEQQAKQREEWAKQREQWAKEAEARKQKLEAVKRRATNLLLQCLTKTQKETLAEKNYFDVEVSGKKYRINRGTHGNVKLMKDDKAVMSYCIQPNGVPTEDAMLAQKLLLETDEPAFLRIANATQLRN